MFCLCAGLFVWMYTYLCTFSNLISEEEKELLGFTKLLSEERARLRLLYISIYRRSITSCVCVCLRVFKVYRRVFSLSIPACVFSLSCVCVDWLYLFVCVCVDGWSLGAAVAMNPSPSVSLQRVVRWSSQSLQVIACHRSWAEWVYARVLLAKSCDNVCVSVL